MVHGRVQGRLALVELYILAETALPAVHRHRLCYCVQLAGCACHQRTARTIPFRCMLRHAHMAERADEGFIGLVLNWRCHMAGSARRATVRTRSDIIPTSPRPWAAATPQPCAPTTHTCWCPPPSAPSITWSASAHFTAYILCQVQHESTVRTSLPIVAPRTTWSASARIIS